METKTIVKVAAVILTAAVIPVLLLLSKRKTEKLPVRIVRDTNLVSRYEQEHKTDTVLRFADRILYRKQNPEIIYVQKTDTVFTEKIISTDLPLRIEKSRDELNIKAVNLKDSTLKEYVFRDVSRDFTAFTSNEGINVKSRNFSIEYPGFDLRTVYLPSKGSSYYEIHSEAGINYKERVSLSAGCGYGTLYKNIFFTLSLKLKGL